MKPVVLCVREDVQACVVLLQKIASGQALPVSKEQASAMADRLALDLETYAAEDIASDAYDQGLDAARKGDQTVHVAFEDPAYAGVFEAWLAMDRPFCRISWFEDSGDPSVGQPGVGGWQLAADQSGSILEELLAAKPTGFVPLEEVDFETLEQRNVVVRLHSGVVLFGRIINRLFCEYQPDVDRFVDRGLPEKAIAGVLVIPAT